MAAHASQNLARLAVDRKASKGRKVQFEAHERLVNYMAPRPCDLPTHIDSLFQSLFWSARPAG
jgi:protein AATF/BFR2